MAGILLAALAGWFVLQTVITSITNRCWSLRPASSDLALAPTLTLMLVGSLLGPTIVSQFGWAPAIVAIVFVTGVLAPLLRQGGRLADAVAQQDVVRERVRCLLGGGGNTWLRWTSLLLMLFVTACVLQTLVGLIVWRRPDLVLPLVGVICLIALRRPRPATPWWSPGDWISAFVLLGLVAVGSQWPAPVCEWCVGPTTQLQLRQLHVEDRIDWPMGAAAIVRQLQKDPECLAELLGRRDHHWGAIALSLCFTLAVLLPVGLIVGNADAGLRTTQRLSSWALTSTAFLLLGCIGFGWLTGNARLAVGPAINPDASVTLWATVLPLLVGVGLMPVGHWFSTLEPIRKTRTWPWVAGLLLLNLLTGSSADAGRAVWTTLWRQGLAGLLARAIESAGSWLQAAGLPVRFGQTLLALTIALPLLTALIHGGRHLRDFGLQLIGSRPPGVRLGRLTVLAAVGVLLTVTTLSCTSLQLWLAAGICHWLLISLALLEAAVAMLHRQQRPAALVAALVLTLLLTVLWQVILLTSPIGVGNGVGWLIIGLTLLLTASLIRHSYRFLTSIVVPPAADLPMFSDAVKAIAASHPCGERRTINAVR